MNIEVKKMDINQSDISGYKSNNIKSKHYVKDPSALIRRLLLIAFIRV